MGTDPACHYGVDRWYPFAGDATVADVERYPLPDPERFDYGAAALGARSVPDHAVRGPYWLPVFCRVCGLLGAEEALVALRLRPRVFEALVTRIVELNCAYCERLLNACGDSMDIFCIGDDCGPDHHIKPDASPANTVALFETGREFRADGWTTG